MAKIIFDNDILKEYGPATTDGLLWGVRSALENLPESADMITVDRPLEGRRRSVNIGIVLCIAHASVGQVGKHTKTFTFECGDMDAQALTTRIRELIVDNFWLAIGEWISILEGNALVLRGMLKNRIPPNH